MIVATVEPVATIYHVPHGLVGTPLNSVLLGVGAVAPTVVGVGGLNDGEA